MKTLCMALFGGFGSLFLLALVLHPTNGAFCPQKLCQLIGLRRWGDCCVPLNTQGRHPPHPGRCSSFLLPGMSSLLTQGSASCQDELKSLIFENVSS